MIDYYKVLNVPPDVTPEALREQYRFLLNAFHPDKFSSPGLEKNLAKAEMKTKELNAAYEVLKSPASRCEYDRLRAAEKERLRRAAAPPPPVPPTPEPARTPSPPPVQPSGEATALRPAAKPKRPSLEDEELIAYCLQIMQETGRASGVLFQRRLRIGYVRSARLMAIMESRGLIGPDQGAREHEILLDLGPRPAPVRPPTAAAVPMHEPATKSFDEERRRILAEQQRLEAELRLQQIAAARPLVRSRRAPLANLGCWQGCGCMILAVFGLMFMIGLSKSCTRTTNAPPGVSSGSFTPPQASAPPSSGREDAAPSPAVRRALPIYSGSPSGDPEKVSPGDAVLPGYYTVTGISRNDALNVHDGPGSNYEVTARLPNGYQKVQVNGISVMNGTTEWVQIKFKNQSGWVTKAYLRAQ